jgi:hypothetical protein
MHGLPNLWIANCWGVVGAILYDVVGALNIYDICTIRNVIEGNNMIIEEYKNTESRDYIFQPQNIHRYPIQISAHNSVVAM